MALIITAKKCIGCGICVQACPVDALEIVNGISVVDEEKCIKCGKCVRVCPTSAIELEGYIKPKDTKPKKVISAEKANTNCSGVWVLVEQSNGEAAEVSWELIGEARKLADKLGTEVAGVVLGEKVDRIIPDCFAYGADTVYVVDNPVLKDYRTEPYSQALSKLIKEYSPEIVLMGATTLGRDLAGHTATLVSTGLTADCTELSIEEETRLLRQTRPAFGGNVMATIVCADHRPQMATVRPKVMEMPVKKSGRAGKVIREELEMKEEDVLTKIIEKISEKSGAVYLDKADVIVAAGKGIGTKENMKLVEDLAEVLGGTIGASRAAVEAGWIDVSHQVGQTGFTVRPKLYISVGISGAIQHLVGMQTSDVIIAINSDENAPIFNIADYGIVGDFQVILPKLTEAFRKKLGS